MIIVRKRTHLTQFLHHLYEMNHTNTYLLHLWFVCIALLPTHSPASQMLKLGKEQHMPIYWVSGTVANLLGQWDSGQGATYASLLGHWARSQMSGFVSNLLLTCDLGSLCFCFNFSFCNLVANLHKGICNSEQAGISCVLQYQAHVAAAEHQGDCVVNYKWEVAYTAKHGNIWRQPLSLSHQKCIGVVQLCSTFPRLWSAENCLITWYFLLHFWAVETMNWWYAISFLLFQYHISIKIIATDTTEAKYVLRNSRKSDLWYKLCIKM